MRMKNTYLFLIASHSNRKVVEQLSTKLEEAGYRVWLGQGGDDSQQRRQTEFAIERSDTCLLALSPEAPGAANVARELALVQEAGKPLYVVQVSPTSLPNEWNRLLADRPIVDLSDDFDAGLAKLLAVLAGSEAGEDEGDQPGNFFGGEYFGRVPALPGEKIIWSDGGLYWFKKWRTLVRVLVTLTERRLIFFWDARDNWKWKSREADELEDSFPLLLPLDQITAVGEINKPKSFLIFATGRPYVEFTAGNQLHRFSLETEFDARIETLRNAVAGQAIHDEAEEA
jgi:hypothetical protein